MLSDVVSGDVHALSEAWMSRVVGAGICPGCEGFTRLLAFCQSPPRLR